MHWKTDGAIQFTEKKKKNSRVCWKKIGAKLFLLKSILRDADHQHHMIKYVQ